MLMDSKTDILKSCLAEFRTMPDANTLICYLSRDSRLTFDERLSITRSIEKAFSPMFLEMKRESSALSESDLIYCALIAAGFSPEIIADCISISKDSLRMRKIRVKEKLSRSWVELLFPEQDVAGATKGATKKCDDNVAQHNSDGSEYGILLQQNPLNSKVMQTKKVSFGQAVVSGWKNCFKYTGRASRSEFWYFILFDAIVLFIMRYVVGILAAMCISVGY